MSGSLIGCWYTDTLNQVISNANGEILAIGNEHFVGCLDTDRDRKCARRDPHGTLAFVYAFEGRFDKAGNEIRGKCQHPILSGTGDFTGAQGRLDFKDNVETGHALYRGQLTLAKHSSRARAIPSARRRSLASGC
jgi:hypothetical protein